jgi:hypothetical protein
MRAACIVIAFILALEHNVASILFVFLALFMGDRA